MKTRTNGARPGLAAPAPGAPQKSESPAATGQTQHETTKAAILAEADLERKRFDTLAARAALAGLQLSTTARGFLLSAGTRSRHVNDLDVVEALVRRAAGGAQ
jgi:hypothetical protein